MDLARMSRSRRFGGLIVLVFLGSGYFTWAQTTPVSSPTFTKSQYQWAITPLQDEGLESRYEPLRYSLMVELLNGWKNLPNHEFTAKEIQRFQKEYKEGKIKDEEKTLLGLLAAKDALLFKTGGATAQDYDSAQDKITQSEAALATWRALEVRTILGGVEAPLKLVQDSPEKPLLTLLTAEAFSGWMKLKSLDLVVGGSISSVKGYIFLKLYIWNPDQEAVAQWSGWFNPEESTKMVQTARSALTPGLLGRLSTDLTIRTAPPTARIYLDGELQGVGVAELPFWEPGDYTLKLEGAGLVPRTETLSLSAGTTTVIDRTLDLVDETTSLISTNPEGADLYLGGLWLGKTPLTLPLSSERALVEFYLKGYENSSLTVSKALPLPGTIPLEPTSQRLSFQETKERFYLSLGVFSIFFATTALLRAQEYSTAVLYQNYVNYVLQDPVIREPIYKDRLDTAYTLNQLSANGGWVGIGLTITSLIWMGWELINYIQAGEATLYN